MINRTVNTLETILKSLKGAQTILALQDRKAKDQGLKNVAAAIEAAQEEILAANALDVEKARAGGMKETLIKRLALDSAKIRSIIDGITQVVRLEDPVGNVREGWRTSSDLLIEQVTVPLGTISVIYESRPGVTVEAFSLAYKAGCSVLLRGSPEALESNRAIVKAIKKGLADNGVPEAVELADSGSEDELDKILNARGRIDAVLPCGGKEFIRRVADKARIPVIETGESHCRIYVEPSADMGRALEIIAAAMLRNPGVCNAVETLLVHRDAVNVLMPLLARQLAGKAELRCDRDSRAAIGPPPLNLVITDAVEEDWATEFLDYILAVKTVASLDEAVSHMNTYGTKHSGAILTNDLRAAVDFCRQVDAACVYTNTSTRLTDSGIFGFGTEPGIGTQKFHEHGLMGIEALTTIKSRSSELERIRD